LNSNPNSPTSSRDERRTKIVATVGPASWDDTTLTRLFEAGVDVVRLNLSHGSLDDHRRVIHRVRRISYEICRSIAIIADLMGPRFRLGQVEDGPRELPEGSELSLGPSASGVDLPVEDPSFLAHLREGERILIDNGNVELEMISKSGEQVQTRVLRGGPVATRKGINLPDTHLPFNVTEKDRRDIVFAVEEKVDYLAVSFIGGPDDLEKVRTLVAEAGGEIPLVAKFERPAVLEHLSETVQAADAVMVARGDLGVEVPLHQVPVIQKQILVTSRRFGKPVIVATQMLESMMESPRPTRAEASDVANAVFEGADAVMLSGETAAGRYPVESVRTMERIIYEAERYPRLDPAVALEHAGGMLSADDLRIPPMPGQAERSNLNPRRDVHLEIPDTVAAAAVYAASRLDVRWIVAFSQGGFTARTIARYRPQPPILVFTNDIGVARRIQLVWGARPIYMEEEVAHHDEVVSVVDQILLSTGQAEVDDTIIILMGDPIGERPLTNLMRIHRVREQ